MTKRRWTILLAAILLLGGGLLWLLFGRVPIQEGRCRLVREKADAHGQWIGLASQLSLPQTTRPENVRDLPAGFDRPCYYEIKSGGRRIPVVVNLSQDPSLCLDTNGDGILSQERCFTATAGGDSWRFGPISLVSGGDSSRTAGSFYLSTFRGQQPQVLAADPAFFHLGKLRLADRTYQVAVVDGDCDGRFHSILALPLERQWKLPACDVFAIDLNRNGEFETSSYPRSEVKPLARLVQIGGAYYAIDIAPDGTSLSLSWTEPQLGTLLMEPNDVDVDLRLWSDAADQHLSQGRTWQLPAGKYKTTDAVVTKVDALGNVWKFSSIGSLAFSRLGSLESFTIEPGKTTSIRIGPPFVVKADVQMAGPGMVSIGSVLVGCAGEEYSAGVQQGRQGPSPPSFEIVDEKGTVLIADKFQYG